MKRAIAGLVAAVLMVSLAGCAGEPASVATDNAELDALTVRMYALKDRVASAGRMTPELRGDLNVLVRDVEAWRGRTSRSDITVNRTDPSHTSSALINNPFTPSCTPCPLVKMFGGKVCFLVEEGECRTGIISKVCTYICLTSTRSISAPMTPVNVKGES